MIPQETFYHGIIRNTIIGFGSMFSNIFIERRSDDPVTGPVVQKLQIPLAYAPKEKWLVRIQQDGPQQNITYMSLPRMSFEITGYAYDAARKLGKAQKLTCGSGSSTKSFVYTPVPYNIDINLYIITKTQGDALQIIEQILPTFTPEYTLVVKVLPEMNVTQSIPIVLNSMSSTDEYDGDFTKRRFVMVTLHFTLKINLFGGSGTQNVITEVKVGMEPVNYTVVGNPATGGITSETWIEDF